MGEERPGGARTLDTSQCGKCCASPTEREAGAGRVRECSGETVSLPFSALMLLLAADMYLRRCDDNTATLSFLVDQNRMRGGVGAMALDPNAAMDIDVAA